MAQTTTRWPHGRTDDGDWRRRDRVRGDELVNAWGTWMASVPWQFFVTLTFDTKKVFQVGAGLASTEAFWWCTQSARVFRCPLGWLYAVERRREGPWHAHVLLVGAPMELGPAPNAMWQQRNGLMHVRTVDDTKRATLYTTKEAARTGEIVWSDTLKIHLRSGVAALAPVALHPRDEESAACGDESEDSHSARLTHLEQRQ